MDKRLLTIIIALMLSAIVAAPVTAQSGYIQIPNITKDCNPGDGLSLGEKLSDYCVISGFQQEVTTNNCLPLKPCAANVTLSIVKPFDVASPRFLQAAANGMVLQKVTIRYPQPSSEISFYVITLSNAKIVDDVQSFDPLSPAQSSIGPLEKVSFKFEKIRWQWEPGTPICWDFSHNRNC